MKAGMNAADKRKVSTTTEKRKSEKNRMSMPGYPTVVTRQSSETDLPAKQEEEYKENLKQTRSIRKFRSRGQAVSCSSYFIEDRDTRFFMKDPRLTENAKNLTPEEVLALELDILKPLDFYEIFFNRMKAKDDSTAVNRPETGHDV